MGKQRKSGIALLVAWANDQDHWVRALVGEVLATRRALSANVIEGSYQLLLAEKGLSGGQGEAVIMPPLEFEGNGVASEQSFRLTTLSSLANVNALAADQSIAFHPRMTVLYGENGAGKTGYVRVLKRLGAVRTAEPVLPNIGGGGTSDAPTGSISYELDNKPYSLSWSGEAGVAPFTRMDIFDSHSVEIHVDGELTYTYTPGELAVFRHTHDAIEAVKERLDKARAEAQPSGNPYLNKFSREGSIYVKIETLGAATDIAELEKLSAVTDADKEQLEPLKERVDALRSGTSDARIQIAENESEFLERVVKAIEAGQNFDLSLHARALAAVATTESAHTHATKEALSGEQIPGVLEDSWRRFVEAGETYVQEHYSSDYPHEGESCPYCLQQLSASALVVLRKYRAFCRSELQDALEDARRQLSSLIGDVAALDLEGLEQDLQKRIDSVGESGTLPANLGSARRYLNTLRTIRQKIDKGKEVEDSEFLELARQAGSDVKARKQDLEQLVRSLRSEVTQRKEFLALESTKLRELQDRIMLGELFPSIRDHVGSAKWASRASTLLGRLRQLGKTLTDTSKIASEQLLNEDFETTFREECTALRAPAVTLDFPGRKGQPARRKRLSPLHRLSAILSEGEQKVIALADFIAEAMLRRSSTPLVLDDPVTSLDYKRLEHVVDRLVELSKTRQVVIFTHNIWFTMLMLGRFDRKQATCSYYDVSDDGIVRGIVSLGQSPKLDTWGDRKKRINLVVGRIKQEQEKTMRDVLIEKGYEDLRGACEIVVEQDLLQSVVQSYTPNVMVDNLLRMKFEALPQASKTVCEIFNRCCRFIGSHKQPIETLSVRPTLEGLEKDWKDLQEVHSQFSQ